MMVVRQIPLSLEVPPVVWDGLIGSVSYDATISQAIWTEDIRKAFRVAGRLRCGLSWAT